MQIRRIHIIGGSGSGKTYISDIVSNKLGIKRFDLDEIFWDNSSDSYNKKADIDTRTSNLLAILNEDSWIIEGVYYSWLEDSFKRSDIIFILKTNVLKRDYRIIKRFIKRKLGLIPSKNESIQGLIELIRWNHKYDRRNLKEAENMIDLVNQNKYVIKNNMEIIKIIDDYDS